MVFKNLFILVLWTIVAFALKVIMHNAMYGCQSNWKMNASFNSFSLRSERCILGAYSQMYLKQKDTKKPLAYYSKSNILLDYNFQLVNFTFATINTNRQMIKRR